MKIQLVLFVLIFAIMSLVPFAMDLGSVSSDAMILLILSLSFFGFFYQDRVQRKTKNVLKQGIYLILCLMSMVFSLSTMVQGIRDSGNAISMVAGSWFLGEGIKNLILKLTRRPVAAEYQGIRLHPYKKNDYVPWFYYHRGEKACRCCPDGPWERGDDFPTPGEVWTVYISPLSPLDCALTRGKLSIQDAGMILVGLSIIRKVF